MCTDSTISFLNNFENFVNHRVDIREDIKHYQDTLSYTSSKVNYSRGQNIYMLPSDMNLKIKAGTVGYNNKILVPDAKFSLGKNEKVNLMVPAIKSHKVTQTATNSNDVLPPHRSHAPNISHKNPGPKTILIMMKKLLLYWLWQVVLPYGIFFDESSIKCMGHLLRYINHMSVSLMILNHL